MAKNKNNFSRKKKSNGRLKPGWLLLIVVLLIGLGFLGLESLTRHKSDSVSDKGPSAPIERHQIPLRQEQQVSEYQPYTTATETQPVLKHKKKRSVGSGTVAIIVDDMGSSVAEVNSLMEINIPLTFSLIPGLAKDRQVAEAAHSRGYQVMLHMPMEPQGYPRQRLEKNGLLMSSSAAEIEKRMTDYLREVPYVVGANNHMGSRFTEDETQMGTVIGYLKGKSLFFIDSRTSPKSVGYSLARKMGVETGTRNVFLDNVQDVHAIQAQLEQLAAQARRRGGAIGICHPHQATIQALAQMLPALKEEGINFVFASELVR